MPGHGCTPLRFEKIIFSVPSGNFGDMMGGCLAMKMGLPVGKFIIATNENDEFPGLLYDPVFTKRSNPPGTASPVP